MLNNEKGQEFHGKWLKVNCSKKSRVMIDPAADFPGAA